MRTLLVLAALSLLGPGCAEPPRPAAPAPECLRDSDCPEGLACGPGGACVPSCAADRDCRAGESCVEGRCVAPSRGCRQSSDCAPGEACGPSGVCAKACITAAGCGAGGQCIGGACVSVPPACGKDADCGPGRACTASGACAFACASARDCAPDETCSASACVPAPRACTASTQCAAPLVCSSAGVCTARCAADRDCGAGQTCSAGACALLPAQCARASDCPGTKGCVAGACADSCVDSRDCGLGQSCTAGSCVLTPPECATAADCAAGRACAPNGTCVKACSGAADCSSGTEECSAGACVPATASYGALTGSVSVGAVTSAAVAVTLRGAGNLEATFAPGSFRLAGLPAGRYALSVQVPSTVEGTASADVLVRAGTVAAVPAMTFTPVGRVAGKALLQGQTRHDGTRVLLSGTPYAATTDAAGAYALEGVAVGSYDLLAVATGYVSASKAAVAVQYGQTATVADVSLAEVPAVNGSTFAFTSKPPAKAFIGRALAYTAVAGGGGISAATYGVASGPPGFAIDAVTGAVAFTPPPSTPRSSTVALSASSGGLTVYQVFRLEVSPPVDTLVPGRVRQVAGAGGVVWALGDDAVSRVDAQGTVTRFDATTGALSGKVSSVEVLNGGSISRIDGSFATIGSVRGPFGAYAAAFPGGKIASAVPKDTLTVASVSALSGRVRSAAPAGAGTVTGVGFPSGAVTAVADGRRAPTALATDTGVVSAVAGTVVTDASAAMTPGAFTGKCLTDASASRTFTIAGNDATTLTVTASTGLDTTLPAGRRYFVVACASKLASFRLDDAAASYPAAPGFTSGSRRLDAYLGAQWLGTYTVTGSDTTRVVFDAPVTAYAGLVGLPASGTYALADSAGNHAVKVTDSGAAFPANLAATNRLAFEGGRTPYAITANDATSVTITVPAGSLAGLAPGLGWLLVEKTTATVRVTVSTTADLTGAAAGSRLFINSTGTFLTLTAVGAGTVEALVALTELPLSKWLGSAAVVPSGSDFLFELTDATGGLTPDALAGMSLYLSPASYTGATVSGNTATALTVQVTANCGVCAGYLGDIAGRFADHGWAAGSPAGVALTVSLSGSPNLSPDLLAGRKAAPTSALGQVATIASNGPSTLTAVVDSSAYAAWAAVRAGERLVLSADASTAGKWQVTVTDAAGGLTPGGWAGHTFVDPGGGTGVIAANTATALEVTFTSPARLDLLEAGAEYAIAQPGAQGQPVCSGQPFIPASVALTGATLSANAYSKFVWRHESATHAAKVVANGASSADLQLCAADFPALAGARGTRGVLSDANTIEVTLVDPTQSWVPDAFVGQTLTVTNGASMSPIVGNTATTVSVRVGDSWWLSVADNIVAGASYNIGTSSGLAVTLTTSLNLPRDSLALRWVRLHNRRQSGDSRRVLVLSNDGPTLTVKVSSSDLAVIRGLTTGGKAADLVTTSNGVVVKVTDAAASFTPGALRGRTVQLFGQNYEVVDNTATTFTAQSSDGNRAGVVQQASSYAVLGMQSTLQQVAALPSGEALVATAAPTAGLWRLGASGLVSFTGRLTAARTFKVVPGKTFVGSVGTSAFVGPTTVFSGAWAFGKGELWGAVFARTLYGDLVGTTEIADNASDSFTMYGNAYNIFRGDTVIAKLFDVDLVGATLTANALAGRAVSLQGVEYRVRSNTATTLRLALPRHTGDTQLPPLADPSGSTLFVLDGPFDSACTGLASDGTRVLASYGTDGAALFDGTGWRRLDEAATGAELARGAADGWAGPGALVDSRAALTPNGYPGARIAWPIATFDLTSNTATELRFSSSLNQSVFPGEGYRIVAGGARTLAGALPTPNGFYAGYEQGFLDVSSTISRRTAASTASAPGANDGLPCTAVNLLAGTPSNLWLACSDAVAHYDGVAWTRFTRASTESGTGRADGLASDATVHLFADAGGIWATSSATVSRLASGRWTQYGAADGLTPPLFGVVADAAGKPLFATTAGLVRLVP